MIKNIFSILVVLVVGILVYNYFYGTDTERQQSKQIFNEGKELVVSVFDLIKSEKQKFDAGKYDQALDKMGDLFNKLRDQADQLDPESLDRISELEQRRQQLQEQLQDTEASPTGTEAESRVKEEKVDQFNDDIKNLMEETQNILRDLERKE